MITVLLNKFRYYLYLIPFIFFFFFLASPTFSQTNYSMSIENGRLTGSTMYEFDIYLKSIGDPFELTSYQCVLSFNNNLTKSGNLSFSYIEGTSELSNSPASCIGINSTDNASELTFASMPGNDVISENSKKVGSFRMETSNSFEINKPEIGWNFEGMIGTILTGPQFENITQPSNHTGGSVTASGYSAEITDFSLSQNYPNPFNPSTIIRFNLKENGSVKLIIYNLLGEMVSLLIESELTKGTHEIVFNASGLASGVYIYRLDVENKFSSVRKMILAK